MKRRRVILLVLACLVVGLVAFVVWPGEREPEYQGKKLSWWLNAYKAPNASFPSQDLTEQGREAVRQIGTNALPCLLKWIRYHQPAWRTRLYWNFRRLPLALRTDALELRLGPYNPYRADAMALRGFEILGRQARPAFPELMQLFEDSQDDPQIKWRAASCLGAIGWKGEEELH